MPGPLQYQEGPGICSFAGYSCYIASSAGGTMNSASPASKPAINKENKVQQEIPEPWQRLMAALAVPPSAAEATFAGLAARYQRPRRVYHTLAHARQVADGVGELASYAEDPAATRLAAWYHDAVYQPGAPDNEARSAAYAVRSLAALALPPALIREVERLIHLTRDHRPQAGDGNGQVLADADLAILGASPAAYAAYARAIRREYAFIEPEAYRRGRLKLLRGFLARPHIFHTPAWQQARERQARRNLQAEIARLER